MTMQTMKFDWSPKSGMVEGVNAFLNPYLHLIKNNNPKWETRKIQYYTKVILVTIRAFEVDYDKKEIEKVKFPWYAYNYDKQLIETVKQPWYAYKFVKYEVKPNSYGIEEIWFIKDKGWFVVGEKLELWRVYS